MDSRARFLAQARRQEQRAMELQCRIQMQRRLQMNMMQAQYIRSVEYQHTIMTQVQQSRMMGAYMRLASIAAGGHTLNRGTDFSFPWIPHTSIESQSVL